jgi:hypothetical protein
VVEGTAEVVDGIADDETPLLTDPRHLVGDEKDLLGFRVELPSSPQDPRLAVTSFHGPPKIVYVGLCPVQLRSTASEAFEGKPVR